jgi:hypothetical protein
MQKTKTLLFLSFLVASFGYGQSADVRRIAAAAPLTFEQNAGQTDASVKFLSRGASAAVFIQPDGVTLALSPEASGGRGRQTYAVAMRLVGAAAQAQVEGEGELPARSNYFIGGDPSGWRRDIPHFERVRVKQSWPGIDVVYYSTPAREYEFDFVVAPGGDPNRITLEFAGAEQLGIDSEGGLSILLGGRILQWKKPVAYQEVNGRRVEVAANYFRPVDDPKRIKLSLGSYDRERELIIDPVIVYSTFLGGASSDFGQAVAVNAAGEAYVAGRTFSVDFPILSPLAGGNVYRSSEEAFVTKFNAAGTAIVFSTYIGGHSADAANDIALDAAGNVYVVGRTVSQNFPVTPGAKQTVFGDGGNFDGFALKLGPAGNTLIYSTFLGGPNADEARAVAVDSTGHAYVVGEAENAVNLITIPGGFQMQPGGGVDGFLIKLHPVSGSSVYETFWGTAAYDALRDVAVNAAGEAIIVGQTFTNHAQAPLSTARTPPVLRPVKGPNAETVITKVAADGASRIWATYFGGSTGFTDVFGVGLDAAGNIYFAGTTTASDLPVTAGAPKSTLSPGGGQSDSYVAKLDPTGTTLLYSTYLGGNSQDEVRQLVVSNNRATVVGQTYSANLATVNPLIGQYNGLAANTAVSNVGGTTWSTPATPPANARDARLMRAIAVDPITPSIVYAGNFCCQIMKSTDSGASWTAYNTPAGSYEINAIAVARSSTSTVYAATSAGVLKSTDSGLTWSFVNSGLSGLSDLNMATVAVSPTNPNVVYVGATFALGASVFGTDNGGTSWSPASAGMPTSADVRKLLFDPTDAQRLWAATSEGFYLGVTATLATTAWAQAVSATSAAFQDIAVDNTGLNLYAASFSTLWRSTDRGLTWTPRTTSGLKDFIQAIGVEPGNGNVVYAASYARGVRKSTNAGVSFGNPTIPTANVFTRGLSVGTDNRVHVAVENLPDMFVTQVNETGTAFAFSSYLGGAEADLGNGIAADGDGNLYVTGEVNSTGFPVTSSAPRRDRLGTEGVVMKIGPGTPACSISAFGSAFVFPSTGGSSAVSVVAPSGCSWDATTAADWVVIHRTPGATAGSGGFYVTVRDNTGASARAATINISGSGGSATVNIAQMDGGSCPYFLSANFSSYLANGGSDSFSLVTLPGCPWSLINSTSWVQVSPAFGAGPATLNLTVAPNPSPVIRTFNLSFGVFNHLVQQASGCAFVMTPSSLVIPAAGGTQTINVFAPAGCGWSVTTFPTWMTVGSGSGSGNGTITVTAQPNHTGVSRVSVLSIGFRSVTITQSASTCSYSLSSSSAPDQTQFGGPISVNLSTGPTCSWNARSLVSWVRIQGADSVFGLTGTGPRTFNMFVLGNPERAARLGTLSLAGQTYSVNQAMGSPVLAYTAFVQNLYLDLLERRPEAAGLNFWVNQLNTGAQSREQVAGAYFNAPEFVDTAQFVISFYLGLLSRDPDFPGWNYWMSQLRSGRSRISIVTEVMGTPEVSAIYDPLSPSAFVNALYVNLLGRPAAPAEIAFWLGTGLTRPQMTLQFLESAEFQNRIRRRALANACYLGFLRRTGEPAGLAFWEAFQASGTLADLVAAFINSPEYLARPFSAR